MKNSTIITCIIVLSSNFLSAQQERIDNLHRQLSTSKSDTNRVNILAELASLHPNNDSSITYAQKGITLCEKIDYPKGEAKCFFQMGLAYMSSAGYLQAIQSFQKSLEVSKKIGDEEGMINGLEGTALLYYIQKDLDQELKLHFEAARLCRKLNISERLAAVLGNIGKTYREVGKLDSAEIYLDEGYKLCTQSKDSTLRVYILTQIADLFSEQGKDSLALTFLREGLLLENEHRRERLGDVYLTFAKILASKC